MDLNHGPMLLVKTFITTYFDRGLPIESIEEELEEELGEESCNSKDL